MQGDPAFLEIPGCFPAVLYLLTPKWAPAAPVTHRSRGWAKKPKIASFLIIQGSSYKGDILASQIRCTQPPLVTFSASWAFLCWAERLMRRFSLYAGAAENAFPGDAGDGMGWDGWVWWNHGHQDKDCEAGWLCFAQHWQAPGEDKSISKLWPRTCCGYRAVGRTFCCPTCRCRFYSIWLGKGVWAVTKANSPPKVREPQVKWAEIPGLGRQTWSLRRDNHAVWQASSCIQLGWIAGCRYMMSRSCLLEHSQGCILQAEHRAPLWHLNLYLYETLILVHGYPI